MGEEVGTMKFLEFKGEQIQKIMTRKKKQKKYIYEKK
jgi:hypothetical protein